MPAVYILREDADWVQFPAPRPKKKQDKCPVFFVADQTTLLLCLEQAAYIDAQLREGDGAKDGDGNQRDQDESTKNNANYDRGPGVFAGRKGRVFF